MPPTTSERSAALAPHQGGLDQLQARVDHLAQQLLQARDAAIGAEAELGVARARVAELEQHLHVRTVEVEELQQKVLALTADDDPAPDRPGAVARRLGPLMARTAKRTT